MTLRLVTVLSTVLLVGGLAGASVLHDNVKVIRIGADPTTGQLIYKDWHPNPEERADANNFLVNFEASRFFKTRNVSAIPDTRLDYIDNPTKLTYSSVSVNAASQELVVELLVVCDKEFGDIFQHDDAKVLDYLTVYFWDVNMKYKTLPGVNLSFRITGVVDIMDPRGQSFIEDARDTTGKADFHRILPLFMEWVPQNSAYFPKFDLAVAITNADLEWGGGLAWLRHACTGLGSAVFNDGGVWQSTTNAAHEIAHTLGAPHDQEIPGCQATGYIMSGATDHKYFFSSCSDDTITGFVTSDQATCLRRIDEPGPPQISQDFSDVLAPTPEDHCKQAFGPAAFLQEADKFKCYMFMCIYRENGWTYMNTLNGADNALCSSDGGRCFRGICRAKDYLIQNVATGQCMKALDPFAFTVNIEMVDCPSHGTPLDRFALNEWDDGTTLGTPWQTTDGTEHGDRCIYTGFDEGGWLWTDRCSEDNPINPWHGWNIRENGLGEFMLQHRVTGRCAKQEGSTIAVYSNCDRFDLSMRWKLVA